MSPAQLTRLYFPAWSAAYKANWIRDRGTELLVANPPGGDYARQVDALAGQRAARLFRSPKADDLRHGAHIAALGRECSSKDLTNAQLDKLLHFFRLLTNELDLAAAVGLQKPEEDVRRRLVWCVENCGLNDGYVAATSRATQGTANWRELNNQQLGLLVRTLRQRARNKGIRDRRSSPATAQNPF